MRKRAEPQGLKPADLACFLPLVTLIAAQVLSHASANVGSMLTAGYYHSCAISQNGTGACWGDNSFNQSMVPAEYTRFMVASNNSLTNHTWSILYDWMQDNGTLFNWSDPDLGFWLVTPITWESVGKWKKLSAGYSHTCGINNESKLFCWGQGRNRQSLLPQWVIANHEELTFQSISTGTGHSCAVMTNGTGMCWGANDEGQTDVPDSETSTWKVIDAGYAHSCGITTSGEAKCWGWNGVNPGSLIPYGQATVPSGVASWSAISAGFVHTCGVSSSGVGYCWGENSNGQTDVPATLEEEDDQRTQVDLFSYTAEAKPSRWKGICASYFHSCGLTVNGSVICWGSNDAGQGETPVHLGKNISTISTGFVHNCGLNGSGYPICWGPVPHGTKNYWYLKQTEVPSSMSKLLGY